jgi:hypothetical protein
VIPLPLNIKAIVISVVFLATFVAGWTTRGWKHDANLRSALQEKVELQQAYDDYARKVAAKFQSQQATQTIVYRDLKREVPDVTDNRVCFADSNALSLWNNALTGNLPKAATRTTKETASTNTATDTAILINAIENFEQSKAIRDQLNALIDWHETNK